MSSTNGNGVLDLSNLDVQTPAEAGTVVELENPFTGEPLIDDDGKPYFVEVRGEDSSVIRSIIKKQSDRRILRQRKGQEAADFDSIQKENVERMVAATINWYLPPLNGEALEFNEKNARRIYSDDRFSWIADQIVKAAGDRKRFFRVPSKT